MRRRFVLFVALAAAAALALSPMAEAAKKRLAYGGGPTGGTFQYFSNAIAILLSKNIPDLEVSSEGTGGSAENLKRLNSGDIDFGIVYAGDLWLGSQGLLPKDPKKYTNVKPMAFLYGAPAQLVVLKSSGIKSPKDLVGKKVAVGNAGSGAALSAQRFFETIGIWNKFDPQFLGYSAAASALGDKRIDAFWVLVGFPNASIIEASTSNDIDLLDVGKAAKESGFYEKYPFYSPLPVPAGTYKGVEHETASFQDSALWCTQKRVSDDIVYQALKVVYSPAGLDHMYKAHKAARSMKIESGPNGIPLPLATGAYKFWSEKGLSIPDAIKPTD